MSNPTEFGTNNLPDLNLNELEAIALAATPGPWKGDRYDGTIKYDLLGNDDETVIHGDNGNSDHGPFGIENEEDENYLLAFHPATALRLIELARRAQPEGEAPQAELVERFEEWAFGQRMSLTKFGTTKAYQSDRTNVAFVAWKAALATLSPLCGAQQAESGKEVGEWRVGEFWSSANPGKKVLMLACGIDIKNFGSHKDFIRWVSGPALAAQQAAAPGLVKPELMRQAVASVVSRAGDELRIGWLRPERCDLGTLLYCAVEQSAPGIPEAPIVADWEPCNPVCDESPDMKNANCICDEAKTSICRQRAAKRAAQLDGGQEGSES